MLGSQSELSQPDSNDYLTSTESCQGDKSCTSQEENMLPADFMKLKRMHPQPLQTKTYP